MTHALIIILLVIRPILTTLNDGYVITKRIFLWKKVSFKRDIIIAKSTFPSVRFEFI